MKTRNFIVYIFILLASSPVAQTVNKEDLYNHPLYSSDPNHRELVLKSFQLVISAGFLDTVGITHQEISDRLEAGAYNEDFEKIPGIIGEHFPNPWNLGDDFDFNGLYPISKIPYGSITNNLSGWFRGFSHGYDPVQGFIWPGASNTTLGWANDPANIFTWDNAVNLYNSGKKADAYECLGHILHLLADLSIPSHVKVVNHGISIKDINSGLPIDPDLLVLIVDEYEIAIAGGLSIPNVINFIPNLLNNFRNSLNTTNQSDIPRLQNWQDYFTQLAVYTYHHPVVNQYYLAPASNGLWGAIINEDSTIINPEQYGITLPSQIAGRWVQIVIKSTASLNGTVIPQSAMINMCNDLVPKAAEYGAGLIKHFYDNIVLNIENEEPLPFDFNLLQNYPNPFNPSTTFEFQIPSFEKVTLKIYDILGNEIETFVNEELPSGIYKYQWDASGLASGVYFYKLQAGDFVETKKLILMK